MKAFALLTLCALAGWAQSWRLSNASLEVTLSADGSLAVVERASGTRWNTAEHHRTTAAISRVVVHKDQRSLEAKAEIAGVPLQLEVALDGAQPEFDVTLSGPPETPLKGDLPYPFPLRAPAGDYRMVLPHQSGLMYTIQDAATNAKFTGMYGSYNGLSMPWAGMTDLKGGLMMIIDTPEGSGVQPRVVDEAFAVQVYWQPSRETVAYARKLHYRLFTSGGYVAMCKYYRKRLIDSGRFVTLREKQKSLPQLSKLIGAIDLHIWGDDDDKMSSIKYLEAQGVKHMLINCSASRQTLDWMRERGYLVGSYRSYIGIYPPGSGGREELTRGYPQDGYTQNDGTPVRGFAYSDKQKSTYRCSLRQLPLMKELVPPLIAKNGYDAIFLDVVASSPPRDCYSPDHPLNRIEDQKQKIEIFKFTKDLGLVVGSEDGAAWAAPYVGYFEGMVMTRRFGYIRGVTVGNWPQKFDLNDEYINVELNEKVRAPLWDLVFHDSVVSTWRWNFTPDRYSDPKWWNKHDLIHILGGDMPIFLINRQHLEECGSRIVQSYKDVSEWNAKIGWDELVDHRDLTPDRTVQESRFSSGWKVTVNFSPDKPYTDSGGTVVKPGRYFIRK